MSDPTRARWAEVVTERARAHWTPARTADLARGKRLRLPPAEAGPLLRALGILNGDASMPPDRVRKYWQISHMVSLLEPALRELRVGTDVVRLIDAGCGRSYLTLLLAWCGQQPGGVPVEVLGIDRDAAVIEECRRRTEAAGLLGVVRHVAGTVADVDLASWGEVHGVVALHACDTATCDAIALGVARRARLIAVAPCCQAELARAWTRLAEAGQGGAFAPVWGAPHLRHELAAHVTDTLRTLLLRAAGWDARPIELVPDEHTRKNTLIRALRTDVDPAARAQYDALVAATGGAGLALADRV